MSFISSGFKVLGGIIQFVKLGHVWSPSTFIVGRRVLFLFCSDSDRGEYLQIQRLFQLLVYKINTPNKYLLQEKTKRNHMKVHAYKKELIFFK